MRAERAEKEKQDEIEREKQRRKQGREIHEIRQKHDQEEMKRIAEERRREKREAEAHKKALLQQIAQGKNFPISFGITYLLSLYIRILYRR
jgi:UBX domain-containing protein 1/4